MCVDTARVDQCNSVCSVSPQLRHWGAAAFTATCRFMHSLMRGFLKASEQGRLFSGQKMKDSVKCVSFVSKEWLRWSRSYGNIFRD